MPDSPTATPRWQARWASELARFKAVVVPSLVARMRASVSCGRDYEAGYAPAGSGPSFWQSRSGAPATGSNLG